jgi:ribosomal protein S18 acetylase RimI-like enzyme
MALTDAQGEMIAALLNARNELTVKYTRQRVLSEADNYRCKLSETGEVVACVEIKKVQWYQCEVLHLTVAEAHEGKGHAKALLCDVERIARAGGARVLQCTIRDDNSRSRKLFEGFGFERVGTFHNERSGNNVGVFQKVLAPAH